MTGQSNTKEIPPRIVSVTIGPMPRPMPQGMLDQMPTVRALFDDGTEKNLFSYYPDEISFTEKELVGLTEAEAKALRTDKDIAYLQS